VNTVSEARVLGHRSTTVQLADGSRHVPLSGTAYLSGMTLCGRKFDAAQSKPHLPLHDVSCADCRLAKLAEPFVHGVQISRIRLGRGAIKGSGMRYGTKWSCTCGMGGQINTAPSSGGRKSAEQAGQEHLDHMAELVAQESDCAHCLAIATTARQHSAREVLAEHGSVRICGEANSAVAAVNALGENTMVEWTITDHGWTATVLAGAAEVTR
jgi:hypothetical protein